MVQLFAIIPVGNIDAPIDPGFGGGRPGSGGRPDNSLPGGSFGGRDHISPPIYHPGHPDHGLPSGGRGDHIGNQLPWAPGNPDNTLPVPPGVTPPTAPPELAAKLVVLWRMPNTVEWHGKAIDPSLVAGTPLPPTGEPKPV
jgi:hypothetical protein